MGRTGGSTNLARNSMASDRRLILNEMAPALRQLAAEWQQDVIEQVQNNIQFYWSAGDKVLDLEEHPERYLTAEQKAKGVRPLDLFMNFFSTSSSSITKAIRFRKLYPTKADLNRLFGYRNPENAGFRINWGHVVYLITVEVAATRIKFEERCAANGWEPDELHEMIMKHFNGSRRPGSGRPIGIPKTVPKQLTQIIDMSSLWLRRANDVWHGSNHSVFSNVMNVAPDQYTTKTLADLEAVASLLESVKTAAESETEVCNRTIQHVKSALEVRGTINPEEPPTVGTETAVQKVEKPAKSTKPAPETTIATKPLRSVKAVVGRAVAAGKRPEAAK